MCFRPTEQRESSVFLHNWVSRYERSAAGFSSRKRCVICLAEMHPLTYQSKLSEWAEAFTLSSPLSPLSHPHDFIIQLFVGERQWEGGRYREEDKMEAGQTLVTERMPANRKGFTWKSTCLSSHSSLRRRGRGEDGRQKGKDRRQKRGTGKDGRPNLWRCHCFVYHKVSSLLTPTSPYFWEFLPKLSVALKPSVSTESLKTSQTSIIQKAQKWPKTANNKQ